MIKIVEISTNERLAETAVMRFAEVREKKSFAAVERDALRRAIEYVKVAKGKRGSNGNGFTGH